MQKVIFVCLLSLAVGFSKPETGSEKNSVAPPNPAPQPDPTPASVTQGTPLNATDQDKKPEQAANETTAVPPPTPKPAANAPAAPGVPGAPAVPGNITPKNTSTDAPVSISTPTSVVPGDKAISGPTEPSKIPTPAPENDKSATNSSNDAKPNDKPAQTTESTPKITTVKPTDNATKADVKPQTRSFDGPSFIGGIILTLGLIAIGFMGFKYYKSQTERNYHTL